MISTIIAPYRFYLSVRKFLEKHVASSLSVFLRDYNLLYELQSAFRSGHSTEKAMIRLTDQILKKHGQ